MTTFNWKNYEFKDYLDWKKHEVSNLPIGVNISTMCGSCKLNTKINLKYIEDYLPLNQDDVISVKINKEKNRTLIPAKIKKRRSKKETVKKKVTPFYNQITVVIRIKEGDTDNLEDEKKLNLKLFKNGSVQISGLKKIEYCNRALNKLVYRLNEIKGILIDDKISEVKFIEDKINITDFKIYMINSNYKVNLQINRSALYHLLIKKKIKSSFEKTIRACVIVKYIPKNNNDEEKEISVFVFEKGNIIITGARNLDHIRETYKYINNILFNHMSEIMRKDNEENDKIIFDLYDQILKENKHKLSTLGL